MLVLGPLKQVSYAAGSCLLDPSQFLSEYHLKEELKILSQFSIIVFFFFPF